MSARTRFCDLVTEQLGKPVVWRGHGPKFFDCSGLHNWALRAIGGPNLQDTHRAQTLADNTPNLLLVAATPLPGDCIFYGSDWAHVVHIAIWMAGGKVVSADGATSRQLDPEIALSNPSARVRLHDTMNFRRDWLGLHRNTYLDAMDKVTR